MNILFIAKHRWPHVGGVEVHMRELGEELKKKNYEITTISEENIKYPHIKIIGLLYIWFWFLKKLKLILWADMIHIHDVFIWFLPFRFLFFWKKVYITFHGWEGKFPIPPWFIFNKRLANYLSNGSIAVGRYIEKWYGITATYITYGGVDLRSRIKDLRKTNNTLIWLGRLEKDTGLLEFLSWSSRLDHGYKIVFVGDGSLRKECEKYGKVVGNVKNPEKYLITSEYCVPSGYLSYLEAKNYGCKIITFANNQLKKDYWEEISKLRKIPIWKEVADVYISLYNSKR
jgi:glycosyltransferase involved in cell wall biosynthesis